MSYLLFLDESGHVHRTMPYEVRGGVAIHSSRLWYFVQSMRRLEYTTFGAPLHEYRHELKGCRLLAKDRFKWADQSARMNDPERRKFCLSFLAKGLESKSPTRAEFTAYGQACLEMASGIFQLLREGKAKLFAAAIPGRIARPATTENLDYLRKDQVFLLERFYYFLEKEQQHGLLVMDQADKTEDRRFVRRLESYFEKTDTGRIRSQWIVPAPFFVASDMAEPIQAADLAIYCVNWAFRIPTRGMNAPERPEIADRYGAWLSALQFRGQG